MTDCGKYAARSVFLSTPFIMKSTSDLMLVTGDMRQVCCFNTTRYFLLDVDSDEKNETVSVAYFSAPVPFLSSLRKDTVW